MGNITRHANLYDRQGRLRATAPVESSPMLKRTPSKGNYDKMFIGLALHEKSKRKRR